MAIRTRVLFPVLILMVIGFSGLAKADLTIQFSSDSGASFSNNFIAVEGDTLQVELYLVASDAGGVLATNGLFGFGLIGSPSTTAFASFATTSINPAYDFATNNSTSNTLDWNAGLLLNGVPTGQQILLGSVDLSPDASGSTIYTFGDRQPETGSSNVTWLSGTGAELDQDIFGAGPTGTFEFTYNVTAVPEPNALWLMGFAIVGVCSRRRR